MVGKSEQINNNQNDNISKPIIEYFNDDLLPQAIMYGMTPKDFWYNDPALLWSYHIAYINKNKLDIERDNFSAWLNGIYMSKALVTTIAPMLSGKKAGEYFSEPLDLKLEEKNINKSKEYLETRKRIEEDKLRAMLQKVKPKK